MKVVNMYLIRHGETYFNLLKAFQGWSDTPLTPEGEQQIADTAKKLASYSFSTLYSSDVNRARQTASILQQHITFNRGYKVLPELREHFYGALEGQTTAPIWKEIAEQNEASDYPSLVEKTSVDSAQDLLSSADPLNLAETSLQFWERYNHGLRKILRDSNNGDNVLIVSHSSIIRSLGAKFAHDLMHDLNPHNGAVTKLIVTDNGSDIPLIQIKYYDRQL